MSLLPPRHGSRRRKAKPVPNDPLGYSRDRDAVAHTALEVADLMRDEDPQQIADQVCALAWARPGAAAQIIMTLATWLPIETMTTRDLANQQAAVATGAARAAA